MEEFFINRHVIRSGAGVLLSDTEFHQRPAAQYKTVPVFRRVLPGHVDERDRAKTTGSRARLNC